MPPRCGCNWTQRSQSPSLHMMAAEREDHIILPSAATVSLILDPKKTTQVAERRNEGHKNDRSTQICSINSSALRSKRRLGQRPPRLRRLSPRERREAANVHTDLEGGGEESLPRTTLSGDLLSLWSNDEQRLSVPFRGLGGFVASQFGLTLQMRKICKW